MLRSGDRLLLLFSLSLACACAAAESSTPGISAAGSSGRGHAGAGGHGGPPFAGFAGQSGGFWVPPPDWDAGRDTSNLLTVPLWLTAEQVAATLGGSVRFVGATDTNVLLAELAGRESMALFVNTSAADSGERDTFTVVRLPPEHRHRRLVAYAGSRYWLACSYADCGIFTPAVEGGPLKLVAGSLFTGGMRFNDLSLRGTALCASGADVTSLCFDEEGWTDERGQPSDPNVVPGGSPPAGVDPTLPPPPQSPFAAPVHCPAGSDVTEPLLAVGSGYGDAYGDTYGEAYGVTAEGRLVSGQYEANGALRTCTYSSAAFGPPVWFAVRRCGISVNQAIVTADAFYVSNHCFLE